MESKATMMMMVSEAVSAQLMYQHSCKGLNDYNDDENANVDNDNDNDNHDDDDDDGEQGRERTVNVPT